MQLAGPAPMVYVPLIGVVIALSTCAADVVAQPNELVTITVYEPAAVASYVALLVPTLVTPFRTHWYVAMVPLPAVAVAVNVSVVPVQIEVVPLIDAVGNNASETTNAADVVEQPLLLVTITV